jgi:D-amino-acid oxidase
MLIVMNRRDFVRMSGMVGGTLVSGGMFAGCGKRVNTAASPEVTHAYAAPDISFPGNECRLPPVHVDASREIRTVVGLRPYRPSGFVVKVEKVNDTLVVHNYGHGGGGITLSWGTSKLAMDLGAQGHLGAVAVLGSGAVGLATARLLQEAGFAVTVYTKALPPQTTSNIAGGQWFPFYVSEDGKSTPEFQAQLLAAAQYAYTRYQIMVGPRFGIRWMRNYFLKNDPFSDNGYMGSQGPLAAMLPELRDLGPEEHPFPSYKFVRQFDTLLIEPPIYLAAMLDEFEMAGGKIVVGEIADRNAIAALKENLVFNCTGLGARALFQDNELTPVKGQLTFLLPQPEVQYAVIPEDLYMFPRSDGILLGGTHERGVWSLDVNEDKKREILSRHEAFIDGFRPCRV